MPTTTTTTASTTTTTAATTTTTTTTSTTSTTAPTITLTATKRSLGRKQHAVDLRWTGATAANVEVRRNGAVVTTTPNDGLYTDNLKSATGTFRYRVAHPGGTPISNEVTVTF